VKPRRSPSRSARRPVAVLFALLTLGALVCLVVAGGAGAKPKKGSEHLVPKSAERSCEWVKGTDWINGGGLITPTEPHGVGPVCVYGVSEETRARLPEGSVLPHVTGGQVTVGVENPKTWHPHDLLKQPRHSKSIRIAGTERAWIIESGGTSGGEASAEAMAQWENATIFVITNGQAPYVTTEAKHLISLVAGEIH
jgi:hypothetical protein